MRNKNPYFPWPQTIRQQLIVFCLCLIIVPYCVTCIVVYRTSIQSMRTEAEQYILQYGDQIENHLDVFFEQVNELTWRPYYDASVMAALRERADAGGEPTYFPSTNTKSMQYFLLSAGYSRSEFDNVYLITSDGYSLSGADGKLELFDMTTWSANIPDEITGYGFKLIPPYTLTRNGVSRDVFSVIRELRDPYYPRILGYIRIDINQRLFARMMTGSENKYGNQLYVTNTLGDVFFPVAGVLPDAGLQSGLMNEDYALYENTLTPVGLHIYQLASNAVIQRHASALSRFTLSTAVIVTTATILIVLAYSYATTRRLYGLAEMMRHVENGDFQVRMPEPRRDEIGRLCMGFNRMVERIEALIVENYQARILKSEAEFKALQHQIDPHFLYNTLELINMQALESGENRISDTVSSLGRMLRYTVNNDQSFCSLREELAFLEAYLNILKMRNGERLNWEVESPPELDTFVLPRLLLQPLAENAFLHGLNADSGLISVRICREGSCVRIDVEDDGKGISPEELDALRARISVNSNESAPSGHALVNVNTRLRITYGDEYEMSIRSDMNRGTVFTLRLPELRKGGEVYDPCFARG